MSFSPLPVTKVTAGSAPRGSSYRRRAADAGGGARSGLEGNRAELCACQTPSAGRHILEYLHVSKCEIRMVDWLGSSEVLGSVLGGFAFGIYGLKLLFLIYGLALSFQF